MHCEGERVDCAASNDELSVRDIVGDTDHVTRSAEARMPDRRIRHYECDAPQCDATSRAFFSPAMIALTISSTAP
jgi:hypothetical protein